MCSPRINTFSQHYRRKYGCRVGKIPLDVGVTCPNREQGGCIYCYSPAFSPGYLDCMDDIEIQIQRGKNSLLRNRFKSYLGYFQQETTTAVKPEVLLPLIDKVLRDKSCSGIIISTRPDYISRELLQQLEKLVVTAQKECLFELGLQSSHDKSLKLLNRNHSVDHFVDAVSKIRHYSVFEVGAHLIFGIPGESESDMIETLQFVCSQGVDALKFHHLQVLKNTRLLEMYEKGYVQPFSLEAYIDFLLMILPLIPVNIVIHRLWATSHPAMLVAPKWNILATELSRNLMGKMEREDIRQGQLSRNS